MDVITDCMCILWLQAGRIANFRFSCEGAVVWRGYFDGKKDISGARLIVNGGNA